MSISTKRCLICQASHNTLYWHESEDDGGFWCYCNKCDKAYSIQTYCTLSGISLSEFLKNDFEFEEAKSNEVQKMAWPKNFLPLYDKRSQKGVDYIKSRGLDLDDGMFYDIEREGIVFPYYCYGVFCGAQIRYIKPIIHEDGEEQKITTLFGTRLGLLFYNYEQNPFRTNIKAIIVCEGAFNVLSIQQALNELYGGVLNNPFKVVACSGAGISQHHLDVLKDLKDQGFRIISALDADEAGLKGLNKLKNADAITHVALTDDDELDWNDMLQKLGKKQLARFFLGSVKNV